MANWQLNYRIFTYKEKKWKPQRKKEKGGKNSTSLSPRNRKACHSIR
jgi:hypothetical protein